MVDYSPLRCSKFQSTPYLFVPFIGIIINALNNLGGTIFVELIIIYSAVAATIGLVSSTSRTLSASAQDKGIPFSSFFSRVNNPDQIPANAVVISTLISCSLV